jgi:Protein of unknown function (DUF1826)
VTALAVTEQFASRAPGVGRPPSFRYRATGSSSVVESKQSSVLRLIRRTNVDLAIWQRELPLSLTSWLDASSIDDWPSLRQVLAPADVARTLRRHFNEAGVNDCDGRALLIDDVTQLAALYADTLRITHARIRLEPVRDNACTKFHRDCVRARLITTYRGPGTEWVKAENAEIALSQQHDYDGELFRMPTQSVGMFKGCVGGGEAGVHHRSPQIADSGLTRLFFCVDAAGPAIGTGA